MYSREECCKEFDVQDSDDNVKVLEDIIAKLPDSSVAMFDEVPLISNQKNKRKPSYDWSSLKNSRAPDVSIVICLQPLKIGSTLKHKAHFVKGPAEADVIELVKQFRSSTTILEFVNKLCQERLPIEYTDLEAKPSHEVEGPDVTVVDVTEETNRPAFRAWIEYQFNRLACTPADVKIISALKSEDLTSIFHETKWQQSLITLDEYQGCEIPLAVVLYSKENKLNYSNLLEMSSRAQLKLILVIQDNPTLLENIDESLVVNGDDMMSLYKRLKEVQKTIITELKDMTSSFNDIVKELSTYTAVGKVPNTEDDRMSMFTKVFNNLQALVPKWKTLQGRGKKSLQMFVQGQAAEIENLLNSPESRLDTIVSRASETKEVLEFHKSVRTVLQSINGAEENINNPVPVSRVLAKVKEQIKKQNEFDKEVSSWKINAQFLSDKGDHIKSYSQKEDVNIIMNVLASVKEKLVSVTAKSQERQHALDCGNKDALEFQEAFDSMKKQFGNVQTRLEGVHTGLTHNPESNKEKLVRHKELLKEFVEDQNRYEITMKAGKVCMASCDDPLLISMAEELKNRRITLCNMFVEHQQKLEREILFFVFSNRIKESQKALNKRYDL